MKTDPVSDGVGVVCAIIAENLIEKIKSAIEDKKQMVILLQW